MTLSSQAFLGLRSLLQNLIFGSDTGFYIVVMM